MSTPFSEVIGMGTNCLVNIPLRRTLSKGWINSTDTQCLPTLLGDRVWSWMRMDRKLRQKGGGGGDARATDLRCVSFCSPCF